jgi:AhpD family alkylhydroperoxidase
VGSGFEPQAPHQAKILATRLLVLRGAQRLPAFNGCSVCTDMHTKDAEHAGEIRVRLNLVAAWRDSKAFTDAERAALAEQGTRIADAASVSRTRPGRTRPSTLTPTSSPRWCAPSPSSTHTTG